MQQNIASYEFLCFNVDSIKFAISTEEIVEIVQFEEWGHRSIQLIDICECIPINCNIGDRTVLIIKGDESLVGLIVGTADKIIEPVIDSFNEVPLLMQRFTSAISIWGILYENNDFILLLDANELVMKGNSLELIK